MCGYVIFQAIKSEELAGSSLYMKGFAAWGFG